MLELADRLGLDLPDAVPSDATGVRLVVRGNAERYFVHLRTTGTVLPWQYYQAGFDDLEGITFTDPDASGGDSLKVKNKDNF